MKKKDVEFNSTKTGFKDSELTLEKLFATYKLLPPPLDVWREMAEKYDIHPYLGDLFIFSTLDQEKLLEWELEIPSWVKFSLYVSEGEVIVVKAPVGFR